MTNPATEELPKRGDWPVDPQDDVAVSKDRIWIDGCFDFTHHGTHSSSHPRSVVMLLAMV